MASSARYYARLGAVQYLYAWEANSGSVMRSDEQVLVDSSVIANGDLLYFRRLVTSIPKSIQQTDKLIQDATNRRIDQIDRVELAILRVGVFELFFVPDVPRRVVLNECIELAKELGDTNSFKFINGVLDKLQPGRSDPDKKLQKRNRTKQSGKEFELINRHFRRDYPDRSDVLVGIGDDAAVIDPSPGQSLVISTDSMVVDTHFFRDAEPADVGYRALATAISDLAATGAEPLYATLNLCIPENDENWLKPFSDGLFELAAHYKIALIGGDTVRGPLNVGITVYGVVDKDKWVSRSGAKPGDSIYITGTLGDAALGVRSKTGGLDAGREALQYFQQRLNRPVPRIEAGRAVREIATAMIDLSDGLLADLGHVLEASGVGARVELEKIPLSGFYRSLLSEVGYDPAIVGGDDYELCFTTSMEVDADLMKMDVPATQIGEILEGPGLEVIEPSGRLYSPSSTGYSHF